MVHQHALERILRYPLRVFRIEIAARRIGVERVLERRQRIAGQARHEPHGIREIDPEGRRCGQPVGEPPAAQQRARSNVGGLGARRGAAAQLALDHDDGNAAAAKFDCERQSGRAGANDENLGF
jgi:hypothetical protein